MKKKGPRFRLTPRASRGYAGHPGDAKARWSLALDDFGGNQIEHSHDDFGHAWPMTDKELRDLCAQICEALQEWPRQP